MAKSTTTAAKAKKRLVESTGSDTSPDITPSNNSSSSDNDRVVTVVPKVNTCSLSELKIACDDVIKELYSRPGAFNPSHFHQDVRLILGWTSVLIALATGYHGYVNTFEDSKPLVTLGVVLYMILSTVMTIYITYFEKQTIFQGKRRTFAARISTERLNVSSTAASSPRNVSGTLPFPFSLVAPPSSSTAPVTAAGSSEKKQSVSPEVPEPEGAEYPSYTLTLEYIHSSNHGKALIHQATKSRTWCFGQFFDAQGRLAKSRFEAELTKLLTEAVGK